MTVIIGIDPHKSSHTATALGADLAELGTIRVRATRATIDQLLTWAAPWADRRWRQLRPATTSAAIQVQGPPEV